jgi:predicted nucleic acid-binding protein
MTAAAAERAGDAWRAHRGGGGTRDRVIADFLVGAHAAEQADRLLTRDRGFHRAAFSTLLILDPTAAG